jgi:hypothetical protein
VATKKSKFLHVIISGILDVVFIFLMFSAFFWKLHQRSSHENALVRSLGSVLIPSRPPQDEVRPFYLGVRDPGKKERNSRIIHDSSHHFQVFSCSIYSVVSMYTYIYTYIYIHIYIHIYIC